MSNTDSVQQSADNMNILRSEREMRQGHRALVVWLTGVPASGKSTLANSAARILFDKGFNTTVIDADRIRTGLCSNLGFSPEDRSENVRRIAHLAKCLLESGQVVLVACISPYRADRESCASIIGINDFFEVHVDCPVTICKERDPKGLYARFARGEISGLTGLDAPYEVPVNPALKLPTAQQDSQEVAGVLVRFVESLLSRRPDNVQERIRGCQL